MKMVNSIDYLGKKVTLKIDRPLGTRHQQHGFLYMLNYGYVPDTISGDDEELDAYLIGEFEPVKTSCGKVIGIVHAMINLSFLKMEMIIQMMQSGH